MGGRGAGLGRVTQNANIPVSDERPRVPMFEGMTLFAGALLVATIWLVGFGVRVAEEVARVDDEARS